MTDVLERPRTPDEYRTLAMLADISDLHVEARKRLMSMLYEYRERERRLKDEVLELRGRLAARVASAPVTEAAWTPVLALEALPEGSSARVDLDGLAVLVVRSGEDVFAIANRCTHQGAPLDRGPVRVAGSEATVTCPAHGSVFRLSDGKVIRPPAREPVRAFEARISDGAIELRPRT
jgi:nitrite reductase/ring-hydroxylating ferredoxin subunit